MKALLIALLIIVIPVAIIFGVRFYESRTHVPVSRGTDHVYDYLSTAEFNGKKYRRRPGIDTVLVMGIDKRTQTDDSNMAFATRRGGQADFLQLLVIDSANKKVTALQIDRDTIATIKTLDVKGKASGTTNTQIALSHSYGDGDKQSCQLTVDAVSKFLLDTPVDQYLAMDMDGIAILNDAVGGVTVTLEDDLSSHDPAMVKGATITLQGKQAEYYVRSRMGVGHGTNEERMRRQRDYISKLTEKLRSCVASDKNFAGELYDKLQPYLVTSLSRGRIINDAWMVKDFTHDSVQIPGEHSLDDFGYVKFTHDADALQKIVIDLFYEELK